MPPDVLGGKPIIRVMRIAVEHVLGMLAAGDTAETILQEYPIWSQKTSRRACYLTTFRREDFGILMEETGLDQDTLDDIIRRIVEVAEPEKIILFGSAARGDMNRHSDVDLLIIKEGAHRGSLAGRIYENMHGAGAAVDVVVVTPDDIERYKDSHALVIKPALREGRVVYESS